MMQIGVEDFVYVGVELVDHLLQNQARRRVVLKVGVSEIVVQRDHVELLNRISEYVPIP